jgi:hypothetical protein
MVTVLRLFPCVPKEYQLVYVSISLHQLIILITYSSRSLTSSLSATRALGLCHLITSSKPAPARDVHGRIPRNSIHGGHFGIITARGVLSLVSGIPISPTFMYAIFFTYNGRDIRLMPHKDTRIRLRFSNATLSRSSHTPSSAFRPKGSLPIQPATLVNQHLIPGLKLHEAIDQSVTSVLDSTAAIPATTDRHSLTADQIAIVIPAAPSVANSWLVTTSSSPLGSRIYHLR